MAYIKTIFVFGSNLAGRHGKGAAYLALKCHGAVYGQGWGLQGDSFAIPTKDAKLQVLPLNYVKSYVDKFIAFAKKHPEYLFKVTAIGTGLAGYKHDDIGPMFHFAPVNCILPVAWSKMLPDMEGRNFWVS